MGVNMIVYQVVNEYKKFDEVLSITITGSGASGKNDFFYDIDIEVILKAEIEMIRGGVKLKKVFRYYRNYQRKIWRKRYFYIKKFYNRNRVSILYARYFKG